MEKRFNGSFGSFEVPGEKSKTNSESAGKINFNSTLKKKISENSVHLPLKWAMLETAINMLNGG